MKNLTDITESAAFRSEAREWLQTNRPKESRPHGDAAAERAYDQQWARCQYEGGWAGLSWPTEYGGRGFSLAQQFIWYEEYARAKCPAVVDACWLGVNHAGPTIIAKGSEAQKAEHLSPILSGDAIWCQGFSEPDAGSDLANIRTVGVVDGDEIIVSGQKIWTSYAHLSDRQELLIRTEPGSSRHNGLTWIIGDMNAPGIEVRPIMSLSGDFHNCEVFYDEVRLPVANVVGGLGNGWSVAMATLGFERATAGFGELCELATLVDDLIGFARDNPGPQGRPLIADEAHAASLAEARADVESLRAFGQLTISRLAGGGIPGAESSFARLAQSELEQRVGRLALQLLGPSALDRSAHPKWSHHYLFSFCQTIAGGTSEIQRNIIGERILGLPR